MDESNLDRMLLVPRIPQFHMNLKRIEYLIEMVGL